MRANEIFAKMSSTQAAGLLGDLHGQAKGAAQIALAAAAEAFKLRPEFLRRQPRARQAEWVRRALSRPRAAPIAEEVLAEFFLQGQRPLLVELLDALGVEHEDGELRAQRPECPPKKKLGSAVEAFRKGDNPERRELLLRAFAAQSAVDWPALDELLEAEA